MKNLVFIFLGLLIMTSVSAQQISKDNVDTYLKSGGQFHCMGGQGDTTSASQTIDYTIGIDGDLYGVISVAVESDSVSGTPAYSSYIFASQNGEDWGTPIDTITHTGGADDYAEFDAINATKNVYLIRTITTAAAQKSTLKLHGRFNEGFVIQQ